MTESYRDFARKQIKSEFSPLDDFKRRWSKSDRKRAIIEELEEHGVVIENLAAEVGKDVDPFDLILHVAYDQRPLTRKERADKVRKRNYFAKYGDTARAVLQALLDKYQDEGESIWTTPRFSRLHHFPDGNAHSNRKTVRLA